MASVWCVLVRMHVCTVYVVHSGSVWCVLYTVCVYCVVRTQWYVYSGMCVVHTQYSGAYVVHTQCVCGLLCVRTPYAV